MIPIIDTHSTDNLDGCISLLSAVTFNYVYTVHESNISYESFTGTVSILFDNYKTIFVIDVNEFLS